MSSHSSLPVPPAVAVPEADPTFDRYQPVSRFDELFTPDRTPRPHSQELVRSLRHLGSGELNRRWFEARQLIHENGVTYNVYGDPAGLDRPWQLDPIPLVISASEARQIGSGLIQRATLLEKILADLYGPQQLIREGLIPSQLVFPNPQFLRACHGFVPPNQRYLFMYAADVGRGADGRVVALGDRTQNPSGAGYALENRIVVSRMLPETFRDCRVQRLALFFRTFRDTLRAASPRNRENPQVVLLTPGPYTETYFEHAFLARYLGYTLAEGGDLTVRDNRVYLKLLGGLQPVDVILRRLDDDYCDPLELRQDSFLGVPGLVQAVRTGGVTVANALGTGLVESPALGAYLPQLCRRLMNEELKLQNVNTWWCGDQVGLSHVLANLQNMVVKSTFPAARRSVAFAGQLSRAEQSQLAERIKAKPHLYVGQELIDLSTVPTLAGESTEPRQMVLRTYLTASDNTFAVMPGGLTRVSATSETLEVSMQRGGRAKDTWVLSTGPVNTFSMLPTAGSSTIITRGGGDLPSRVADNLFWLGRYAERAEAITRLLREVIARLTEKAGLGEVPELPTLLRALAYTTDSHTGLFGEGTENRLTADPEAEALATVFDTRRAGSLASILGILARVATTVRDRISTDMWRVLSGLEIHVPPEEMGTRLGLSDALDVLNNTVLGLAAFGGLAADSMTRGLAWQFLDMGRRLERSLQIGALIRETLTHSGATEGPVLEALLEVADSSMTYRRRYLGGVEVAAVLDLLMLDEANPRSLGFQMACLSDDVEKLPKLPGRAARTPEQRVILSTLTALRLADVDRLAAPSKRNIRTDLKVLLDRLIDELPSLSDRISESYFTHLQTSRHLMGR
ncbi:circularly permuted type 2 ATP-grasp protein [Zavarzinella formosa]|uniref:circularly permuted type 2 ATP-grasp protein n=1 Tax=Zavarzinella formosa TaxID=360055 RepID=UPI0002ECB5DC|nr:circularly permuted type 2 ATP-grasp protein [Zavarzinella formosa]